MARFNLYCLYLLNVLCIVTATINLPHRHNRARTPPLVHYQESRKRPAGLDKEYDAAPYHFALSHADEHAIDLWLRHVSAQCWPFCVSTPTVNDHGPLIQVSVSRIARRNALEDPPYNNVIAPQRGEIFCMDNAYYRGDKLSGRLRLRLSDLLHRSWVLACAASGEPCAPLRRFVQHDVQAMTSMPILRRIWGEWPTSWPPEGVVQRTYPIRSSRCQELLATRTGKTAVHLLHDFPQTFGRPRIQSVTLFLSLETSPAVRFGIRNARRPKWSLQVNLQPSRSARTPTPDPDIMASQRSLSKPAEDIT